MEGGTGWITNTTRAADEMMKMKNVIALEC